LSGNVAGHLACSTASATCGYAWVTPRPPGGLVAPISGLVGGKPVQLAVVFYGAISVGATYPAGNPAPEQQNPALYGVTFDGDGHWVAEAANSSITVTGDDSAGATGKVSATLLLEFGQPSSPGKIHLSGTWGCVKPLGF